MLRPASAIGYRITSSLMAEIFGVVSGAVNIAALFTNCIGCFEYIQLGCHFA
ncbi:hypothetical protein F5Y08DRAFT_316881 [Xylaria arbuscula]|nr:hypothetical protein F5Y08DRAFT_316881 [Xylaria arbuscula]